MRLTSHAASVAVTVVTILSKGVTSVTASGLESWLAAHSISTSTTTVMSNAAETTATPKNVMLSNPNAFSACPVSCNVGGSNPSNWTVYHNVNRLARCNQTMLVDFNIYNPLDDPKSHVSIHSCTADGVAIDNAPIGSDNYFSSNSSHNQLQQVQASLQLAWVTSNASGSASEVTTASDLIQTYLAQQANNTDLIAFAYFRQSIIGIYAGAQIQTQGIPIPVLQQFISEVQTMNGSDSIIVQLCGEGLSSKYSFGIVANMNADLAYVQNAVKTWKEGQCLATYSGSTTWHSVTLSTPVLPTSNTTTTISLNDTNATALHNRAIYTRSNCSTVTVASGDTCTSLAAECGISAADFTEYNPSSTLCSKLAAGQHVCCSSGTLPNFAPQPNSNGTCATYLVVAGDSCSELAAAYSLTTDNIESFNTQTWGWMGCSDLQAGQNICLSTGSPPMPASVTNAICGPQMPGTPIPPSGTNLSTLNECPLNACCDIWGQCGTTSEFCTISESSTGAPGTAAVGSNGCISNCGTDIIIGSAPTQFMKVGYFEGFNFDRPCLNEDILDIDYTQYTHVHLGFATITPDFDINVTSISNQFNMFLSLPDVKRVLTIGGWAFSTDPSTYDIFRQAVQAENIGVIIPNIVAFVQKYGLDGVDIDWEYPGEPDIKGIPAGSPEDGDNYFIFLVELKSALAQNAPGTTLSVAVPASYWYLQGFPINAMSSAVDYFILMTYDLHGQWDYNNANSDPGCSAGNCLRSDVNLTETVNALSMITKANVPSSQVVVGVTSYGRSFQMTEAGCFLEMCTYTGPASGAYPGVCTNTSGYLGNAEIDYMNATMENTYSYMDDDSYSNILVFDETQWVSYMDDTNKAVRTLLYEGWNFGGTSDWAIDLQGTAASLIATCGAPKSSTGPPALCVSADATTCTAGTGNSGYEDLCNFTCSLGYCPSPCDCTATGSPNSMPIVAVDNLYSCPVSGLDSSYSGLCAFACKYDYCPNSTCTSSSTPSSCEPLYILSSTLPTSSLDDSSSCTDVQSVDNDQISASWWDQMDTTTQLQNWLNDVSLDKTNFPAVFGGDLDLAQTWGKYCLSISSDCLTVECGSLTGPSDTGTGWKWLVVLSIANLNNALHAVVTAVSEASGNYSTLAPSLFTTYYENFDSSEFSLIEILTGIGTGVAAISSLGGGVTGAAGALFSGAMSLFTNYLSTVTSPDSTATENGFAIGAWDWAGNLTNSLQKEWTAAIDGATDTMIQTLANGSWADYRTHPVLNNETNTDQLTFYYLDVLVAGTVNYLWTQGSIYLYCMQMTSDDFKSQDVDLPDGLIYYSSEGYGCYFQGVSAETQDASPAYYDPPGYANIVSGTYSFTTDNMAQSSLSTYLAYGFNYTAPIDNSINNVLNMSETELFTGSFWNSVGLFNLPICVYAGNELASFYSQMNTPKNSGYGASASWCDCQADKNGKDFATFVTSVNDVSCICDTAGCCNPITNECT